MTSFSARSTSFEGDVSRRFGLMPNFFASAPDAPEIVEKLWDFAKTGYIDNPIPSLFKERLFVYLSRFCEVRYCIARHCAFLLGYGNAAGDPSVTPQTVEQAIRLLSRPTPWQRDSDAALSALETGPLGWAWPEPETEPEDHLFNAATLVFVEPRRSDRAREALRHALGGRRFEYLMGLLAFIRTAHYWTITHPDLQNENDVRDLLTTSDELTRMLMHDPEAARCEMGTRLFAELAELHPAHEVRELERATGALLVRLEQKELLLTESNHRVKNSLQIVSALLHLQVAEGETIKESEALRSAAARVKAIAAVHERLYTGNDIGIVSLEIFLGDLCREMALALGCPEGIDVDIDPVAVPTDWAVPLALIVNELVTNVFKHAGHACRIVVRKNAQNEMTLQVSDTGQGPPEGARTGMGTKIVEAYAAQLGARVGRIRCSGGHTVALTMPVPTP